MEAAHVFFGIFFGAGFIVSTIEHVDRMVGAAALRAVHLGIVDAGYQEAEDSGPSEPQAFRHVHQASLFA
jgi:hypothetical protein